MANIASVAVKANIRRPIVTKKNVCCKKKIKKKSIVANIASVAVKANIRRPIVIYYLHEKLSFFVRQKLLEQTKKFMYVYVWVCVCMCTYMYLYMYVYILMYVYVCVCV